MITLQIEIVSRNSLDGVIKCNAISINYGMVVETEDERNRWVQLFCQREWYPAVTKKGVASVLNNKEKTMLIHNAKFEVLLLQIFFKIGRLL